jgi:hypothetical protein
MMILKAILEERDIRFTGTAVLLAGILASGFFVSSVDAQTAQPQSASPAVKPAAASTPYRNQPDRIANREAAYYQAVWGIANPTVKATESGIILRFSYRVLDPVKAKALNDKKLSPILESPEKRVRLVVPAMDNVGELRQAPKEIDAGRSYWMAFSNSGRLIRPGDRVDIVIGNFRARGLLVE